MAADHPSHQEVNRFLFQEAPIDIRKSYAAVVSDVAPASRHAKLCHLAEASLAYVASVAFSDYRSQRWRDPDPKLEAALGRITRFSMGHFLELLRIIQGLLPPFDLQFKSDAGDSKLPNCSSFAAAVAGIQDAVEMEANNIRRAVEKRRAMSAKSISWLEFWKALVEYRNRAQGHSLSYAWPINHPDYYELMAGPLEAALVEALTTPNVVRVFQEYPVASLRGIRYETGRYVHDFSGESAGMPLQIEIAADDSVTDRWSAPGWNASVGSQFVLHRIIDGYEARAPFVDLMKNGPPALTGMTNERGDTGSAVKVGGALQLQTMAEKEKPAKPVRERRRVSFFGRDAEFAKIEAVLDRVRREAGGEDPTHAQGGHLILLFGESGVGKSSMAQETCRLASERGFDLAEVACEPFHEGMSLFPMREIVRQLLLKSTTIDEIADFFGGDSSQVSVARLSEQNDADPVQRRDALVATFANVVYGRFAATSTRGEPPRPLLIFMDDLERIDVGTSDALLCILTRIREGPVVVLGAYRSDLLRETNSRRHPLRAVFSAARRADESFLSLNLGALSRDSMKDVTAAILGGECNLSSQFYSRLYEETEGNPLFIREILRTLTTGSSNHVAPLKNTGGVWQMRGGTEQWEIPSSIEEAIAARLAFLDANQRSELEKAAVIGRRFAFNVICQLSAASEEEVLGYLESFLDFDIIHELREGDDTFEFSHGKLRDVLYQSMTGLRRRKVHSQVADILLKLQPQIGENWDAMIAEHLYQANRFGEACPVLLRAARSSLRMFAVSDAATQFHKAVVSGEKSAFPAGDERVQVRMQEAEALKLANEHEAAKAIFDELAATSGERRLQGWANNHLGDIHLLRGRVVEALTAYERSEQVARTVGDDELLAETVADLTELYDRQAERLAGVDAEQAKHFRELHDRYLDLEIEMAGRSGENAVKSRAFRNMAKRHRTAGRLAEAIESYQRAVDLSEAGVASHQMIIPFAKTLRLVGRREEAMGLVQRVLDWGVQAGIRRSEAIARQYKGLLLWEMGRSEESDSKKREGLMRDAFGEFERALKLHEEVGFEQGTRETEMLLAEWHLSKGDRPSSIAHFSRAVGVELAEGPLLKAAAAQLRANGEIGRAAAIEASSDFPATGSSTSES